MSMNINGIQVGTTKPEQQPAVRKAVEAAIKAIRGGYPITGRRQQLCVGLALNAMTDAGRRQFAYDCLGTGNRATWESAWSKSRVYPARVWAARVENMTIRIKNKVGPPKAGTEARVAWDWVLVQLNRM